MTDTRERDRLALIQRYKGIMAPLVASSVNTTLFYLEFYCRYLPAEDAWSLTCRETNRHIDYNWKVANSLVEDELFRTEAEARARIMVRKINSSDEGRFASFNIIADPTQPDTSKGTARTPTSYMAENRSTGTCRGLSAQDGERWEAVIDKEALAKRQGSRSTDADLAALEAADAEVIENGERTIRLTKEAQETERRRAAEIAAAEAFATEEARAGFYEQADTFGQF